VLPTVGFTELLCPLLKQNGGDSKFQTITCHENIQGEYSYSSALSLTPAALLPNITWYSLYRSLGRPQGRSLLAQKICPPPPPSFEIRFPDRSIRSESLYRPSATFSTTNPTCTGLGSKTRLCSERPEAWRIIYLNLFAKKMYLFFPSRPCSIRLDTPSIV
jgi:hypothetical protein